LAFIWQRTLLTATAGKLDLSRNPAKAQPFISLLKKKNQRLLDGFYLARFFVRIEAVRK